MEIEHYNGIKDITPKDVNALVLARHNYEQAQKIGSRSEICITSHSLTYDFMEDEHAFSFYLLALRGGDDMHLKKVEATNVYKFNDVLTDFVCRKDAMFILIDAIISKPVIQIENRTIKLPVNMLHKLYHLFLRRYNEFKGAENTGLLIATTGDLAGYANRIEAYMLELAYLNHMEPDFLDWIENANYFLMS